MKSIAVSVVSTSPAFGRNGRVADVIESNGWQLLRALDTAKPDGGVAEFLPQADFLVAGLVGVSEAMLDAAPKLRAVLKHGVGVDGIDIPACTRRGVAVLNTPGANANAVAELVLGLIFALARNIPQGHMSVVGGGWDRLLGTEIAGKTLGIVGLGNIGRRLAVKAIALGMRVVAADPQPDVAHLERHGIELLDLDALLRQSDYVSLHVFGGRDNAALLDAGRIALMKPGACLLNLARGEVVDLDAVSAALSEGRIGGAAVDAFATEPPDTSHPIFSHPRAVFTPHSGADTREAVENMGLMVCEDIATLLGNGRPARVLNPEVFGA